MARKTLCVVFLALFAFAAVVSAQEEVEEHEVDLQASNPFCTAADVRTAIINALAADGNFNLFRALLAGPGAGGASGPANIGTNAAPKAAKLTVFAPTDAAITAAGVTLNQINNLNQAQRDAVAQRHITNSGAFPVKALKNAQTLQTPTANQALTVGVTKANGVRTVTISAPTNGPANTVTVTTPNNIKACKTFIHAVNGVLRNAAGGLP